MRIFIAITILSIQAKAQSSGRSASAKQGDCFEWGVEYHGGGLENPMVTGVSSPDECQHLCQQRQGCQYFEGRDLHGSPGIVSPLGNNIVAGFPDAVKRAVQMGKLVELHASSACTFDHPLLKIVRSVGVIVQDMPEQCLCP